MTVNRTRYTEQELRSVLEGVDYNYEVASQNKFNRYRKSKLVPHTALIMQLWELGKSINYIRLTLSSGKVKPKVVVGRTTIYDFIKRCESGA